MNRRTTLAAVVGFLLLAGPLATAAQAPPPVFRIGVLTLGLAPSAPLVEAFRQGLREHGYAEGQNYTLEFRFAERSIERLPALAAELVRLNVDIIVTDGTAAAVAARGATTTIPIVAAVANDPVKAGLVASLARPGGNVTGLSLISPELSAKRLQVLKETVPRIALVAVIWNPSNPVAADSLRETEAAARSLGVRLQAIEVRKPAELDEGFKAVGDARPDAFLVLGDGMLWSLRTRIVEFTLKSRLPAMFPDRDFPEVGGLMSYGPNVDDNVRRTAALVDRILKGAKPAELPIEQPTRFELVVNLKTARALGLTIPAAVLMRADQVIE
jgi:putative ABC transport system substrate-binding protein